MISFPVAGTIAWVVTANDGAVCRRVIQDIKFAQTIYDDFSLTGSRYSIESAVCDPIDEKREMAFPLVQTWFATGSLLSILILWWNRDEQ